MTETLVSDLVAIIRQAPGDPAPLLATRLSRESLAVPAEALAELSRRALAFSASDEEIALSLGVLLATSRTSEIAP